MSTLASTTSCIDAPGNISMKSALDSYQLPRVLYSIDRVVIGMESLVRKSYTYPRVVRGKSRQSASESGHSPLGRVLMSTSMGTTTALLAIAVE